MVKVTWIVPTEYQHHNVWSNKPVFKDWEAQHYMITEWKFLITKCSTATELFIKTPVSNHSSSYPGRGIVLTRIGVFISRLKASTQYA